MKLNSILAKSIHSRPDVIQFAKDRKYEEAWIISLSQARPSQQRVDEYLKSDNYELLIVEYIWNSKIDGERFVLTVFLDQHCQLQDSEQLVNSCLDLFYHDQDFVDFIQAFDRQIIGHDYLLQQQPESCNMSIFNHWLSVGPVELWSQGEKLDSVLVREKIESRPEIASSKLNYQGLLFRFNVAGKNDGPTYGLKTPCCQKVGEEWKVDFGLVDEWMKGVINL